MYIWMNWGKDRRSDVAQKWTYWQCGGLLQNQGLLWRRWVKLWLTIIWCWTMSYRLQRLWRNIVRRRVQHLYTALGKTMLLTNSYLWTRVHLIDAPATMAMVGHWKGSGPFINLSSCEEKGKYISMVLRLTSWWCLSRYSILPAIPWNSMLLVKIVEGSFNMELFMEFIEGLLDCMHPFPVKNSVIVMDNCHIHKSLTCWNAQLMHICEHHMIQKSCGVHT